MAALPLATRWDKDGALAPDIKTVVQQLSAKLNDASQPDNRRALLATSLLAARARSVTAIDAAPEVLAIASEHTVSPIVRFELADVFTWRPPRRFDTVFFAFWLSHVPPARLAAFWETVAAALAPGGRVIFIDTGAAEAATEEVLDGQPAPAVRRRLNDGSEYRIVKVFHDATQLTGDLAALGWSVRILPAGGNFIVGIAERPTVAG